MRQKSTERELLLIAIVIDHCDWQPRRELTQGLEARATRIRRATIGADYQAFEGSCAFRDRREKRHPLGTAGNRKRRVFHVAAMEHAAVVSFQSGTNVVARVRGIGLVLCLPGNLL